MFDPDGSDIVFVAGAAGSKWSAIAHALMYAEGVNISDLDLGRSHEGEGRALHFGNYFGPGMEFGEGFVDLSAFSREELLREFAAPYREPGGIKLLKSHFFSRQLPYLAETFPKAQFALIHRPDAACLGWWQQAGGFSISFPDYSWYGNMDAMAAQIAIDNRGVAAFAAARGARLVRHRSMAPVLARLGWRYTAETTERVAQLAFERRFGFGAQPLGTIETTCHSMARLASIAIV